MRLTVFAATGGIGRQLVEQAVAAGHDVTAVARNPQGLPKGVRIVAADLSAPDPAALADAVAGADAVLSALGPRRPRSEAGIASLGTRAIVAAMRATGVRRIVVVSAAPVRTASRPPEAGQPEKGGRPQKAGRPPKPEHDPGDGFFMRHLGNRFARALFGDHFDDLAVMEQILRDSDLDWTVSRPPQLTDKPLTGAYRVADGRNIRGGWSVPRADVAHHMLRVLREPETIKQTIGIAT
jgi:putative NADH-flavin reductase